MSSILTNPLKLVFVSTPVGPIGSGLGGGVELTLRNYAQVLQDRGHAVTVIAPEGSILARIPIVGIAGELQITAQTQTREAEINLPGNSVLANMWAYAYQHQPDYDLILNFAYDWLPFYLTAFFDCPIAHLVSMGSLTDAMDQMIGQVAQRFPGTIGVHSLTQAATFPFADQCRCLANGFDLSLYEFSPHPQPYLAWVGRIAPEKALEDGLSAARKAGMPLKILGAISDQDYWQGICRAFPEAVDYYQGFLANTGEMQQVLRSASALLVTPRWVEAFGNVVVEALACGVPVIAYRRGGPAEIVQDGKTGWLVEPDQVDELVAAIARIDRIDRQVCRQEAETRYSLAAMGDRLEQWFNDILKIRDKIT